MRKRQVFGCFYLNRERYILFLHKFLLNNFPFSGVNPFSGGDPAVLTPIKSSGQTQES